MLVLPISSKLNSTQNTNFSKNKLTNSSKQNSNELSKDTYLNSKNNVSFKSKHYVLKGLGTGAVLGVLFGDVTTGAAMGTGIATSTAYLFGLALSVVVGGVVGAIVNKNVDD